MEGENITELVTHLAFQLAAILMAAKIGGEIPIELIRENRMDVIADLIRAMISEM